MSCAVREILQQLVLSVLAFHQSCDVAEWPKPWLSQIDIVLKLGLFLGYTVHVKFKRLGSKLSGFVKFEQGFRVCTLIYKHTNLRHCRAVDFT